MKQKISYSTFNAGVTVATILLWVISIASFVLYGVFDTRPFDMVFFWIMIGTFVICACWTLFCIPTSVSVDDENIHVHKAIKTKKIKISDIKSVEPTKINIYREIFTPFKWTKRLNEGGDGRYYFYYGKPKKPVQINFKDGHTYVVGTNNPTEFIEYINTKIK